MIWICVESFQVFLFAQKQEDNSADVKVLMTGSSVLRGQLFSVAHKKKKKSLRGALVVHTQHICSVMYSCSDLQVKAM